MGALVTLAAVILMHFALWHTSWGFKIRVAGLNARVALNSGICASDGWRCRPFWSAGALAGLAGYMELIGVQHRMIENLSPRIRLHRDYRRSFGAYLAFWRSGGGDPVRSSPGRGDHHGECPPGVPSTLTVIIQGVVVLFLIGRGAVDLLFRLVRRA